MGDYIGVIRGDTRNLDYSSYMALQVMSLYKPPFCHFSSQVQATLVDDHDSKTPYRRWRELHHEVLGPVV